MDPLNLTLVAPEKFVPVITALVSTLPLVGENEVIVGADDVTVKVVASDVPAGFVTVRVPVVAPTGTTTVSDVADSTLVGVTVNAPK